MRLLIVTAVDGEARAAQGVGDALVVTSGIGRTNAACATTQALLEAGPFDAVINAGVGGALPAPAAPRIGEVLLASASVYAEEGLLTPEGFADVRGLGFALGDFDGNAVPGAESLLAAGAAMFPVGRIATVATCSATDAQARAIADRTGCVAEAMEGAAVVHAARRLGVPGIELRAISNTTGDRAGQLWDLALALDALAEAVHRLAKLLRSSGP